MTSPLKLARDKIATDVAALTPEINATPPFRHVTVPTTQSASGASVHRVFWFELVSVGLADSWDAGASRVSHTIAMIVAWNPSGKNTNAILDGMATDIVQIQRKINLYTSLPSGVISMRAMEASITQTDGDGYEIEIPIEIVTVEDG